METALPRTVGRWTVTELHRLGRTPDSVLARSTGRSIKEVVGAAVQLQRQKLGIRSWHKPGWTREDEAVPGSAPDTEIARRLGRSERAVRKRRQALGIARIDHRSRPYTSEELRLLGTAPDAEIARRLGRSLLALRGRRRLLNLPSIRPKARQFKTQPPALNSRP